MNLNKMIIDHLMNINWFENCTQNAVLNIRYGYEFVSIKKLEQSLLGVKWQNIELEEVNKLTEYLFHNYSDLYQNKWNTLVVEFKDKHLKNFDRLLLAKINEVFGNLSTLVINYVHWDILEIVMASTFEDCLEPTFYSEILKIYQNGFFPCGWRGKFPHGNMLIY